MQGAREPIGPVVLLVEFYSSGGTRTYLKQLLHFYSGLKIDVLLVSQHAHLDGEVADLVDHLGFRYQSYASVVDGDGPRTGEPAQLRPWSLRRQVRERRAFRRLLRTVDARALVISVGTPGLFAGASGASPRSLYILHTYPHGRRQTYLGPWFMAWLFRRTPHFLAVSEFQKGVMEKTWRLQGRSADIAVIRNTAGPAPSGGSTWTSSDPRVLTASWVEPYKEPQDWLKIAETVSADRSSPVHFVWMGEGSELEHMQDLANSDAVSGMAEFCGHVDDMDSAYERATVYLQTSSTENMSLSVIDALRWGLPSVVTDVGGLPEIVVDGECGYVMPAHDIHRARDLILRLLEDQELWTRLAEAARDRYNREFSPGVWHKSMTELHARIMEVELIRDGSGPDGDAQHG